MNFLASWLLQKKNDFCLYLTFFLQNKNIFRIITGLQCFLCIIKRTYLNISFCSYWLSWLSWLSKYLFSKKTKLLLKFALFFFCLFVTYCQWRQFAYHITGVRGKLQLTYLDGQNMTLRLRKGFLASFIWFFVWCLYWMFYFQAYTKLNSDSS